MKKLVLLIACIISFTLCFAQTPSYPIVEKNGKKYYEYTITQGDGLFAIARRFGIKQSDLHEANDNLSTDIKAGDKILIPIIENTPENKSNALTTHVVEAKQTLYGISKMYNISVDSLLALNPSAKAGIKVGETLIISRNKSIKQQPMVEPNVEKTQNQDANITHVVNRKETLFSISKKYNVAIHDLISLNPELKNGLKAGTTIIIKGSKDKIESTDKEETPIIHIETPKAHTKKDSIVIPIVEPIISKRKENFQKRRKNYEKIQENPCADSRHCSCGSHNGYARFSSIKS